MAGRAVVSHTPGCQKICGPPDAMGRPGEEVQRMSLSTEAVGRKGRKEAIERIDVRAPGRPVDPTTDGGGAHYPRKRTMATCAKEDGPRGTRRPCEPRRQLPISRSTASPREGSYHRRARMSLFSKKNNRARSDGGRAMVKWTHHLGAELPLGDHSVRSRSA